MIRRIEFTYRGALRILGAEDSSSLTALDAALGGVILASGLPGAATAALWGLVDQKNEAVRLLGQLRKSATARIVDKSGLDRQRLLIASHTVIVVDAAFESLRAAIGTKSYAALEISEADKQSLTVGGRDLTDDAYRTLYDGRVPCPSTTVGFEQTVEEHLTPYLRQSITKLLAFCEGLAGWTRHSPHVSVDQLTTAAVQRYRGSYITISSQVPEFRMWTTLNETSSIHRKLTGVSDEIRDALTVYESALARLERLLDQIRPASAGHDHPVREQLAHANRMILGQSIAPGRLVTHVKTLTFPSVNAAYVTPYFRWAIHSESARPSDEDWWGRAPLGTDLEAFLARYFISPESTDLPLVVLGHPGAGKSLLTRVLAARLPTESFTTIVVPLRQVDPDAPVYRQVELALSSATNSRVSSWPGLVEASRDATRVVLLDGLDELLQATSQRRGGYLEEVAYFQEVEAAQGHPVVAVVTSRTLVADWVNIPEGSLLIRLEDFTHEQVGDWLGYWNYVNRAAIDMKRARPVAPEAVLRHEHLATQPLLLVMLAMYLADPSFAAQQDANLSRTSLYEQLLDNYIRRELSKSPDSVDYETVQAKIQEQMWHLAIVAFGIYNRGRQFIRQDDLIDDLSSLLDPDNGHPDRREWRALAEETVQRFFFVHTAALERARNDGDRSYEFLHATFGEYLIARYVVRLIEQAADRNRSDHQGFSAIPRLDDSLLRPLLAHRPLSLARQILLFLGEILAGLDATTAARIGAFVDELLREAPYRPLLQGGRPYVSGRVNHVTALASYLANLTLVRVLLAEKSPRVPPANFEHQWLRTTVRLWQGGLYGEGWRSLVDALEVNGSEIRSRRHSYALHGLLPADEEAFVGETQRSYLTAAGALGNVIPFERRDEHELRGAVLHALLHYNVNLEHICDVSDELTDLGRLDEQTVHLIALLAVRKADSLSESHIRSLARAVVHLLGRYVRLGEHRGSHGERIVLLSAALVAAAPFILLDYPDLEVFYRELMPEIPGILDVFRRAPANLDHWYLVEGLCDVLAEHQPHQSPDPS
ncbi:NACHT domain-containing protein [Micromonospora parva]|uniref:NACHT domain-containing protein n=2 Tax=Micromonospora TaxID=1873 RepID=UPI0037145E85